MNEISGGTLLAVLEAAALEAQELLESRHELPEPIRAEAERRLELYVLAYRDQDV